MGDEIPREYPPRDPVCGLEVRPEEADSWVEYEGTQYYFCCPECRRAFEEKPEEYAGKAPRQPEAQGEETGSRRSQRQAR